MQLTEIFGNRRKDPRLGLENYKLRLVLAHFAKKVQSYKRPFLLDTTCFFLPKFQMSSSKAPHNFYQPFFLFYNREALQRNFLQLC